MSKKSKSGGRLGIIAGYGRLPLNVAIVAREKGENPFIFTVENSSDYDWPGFDNISIHVGDFAKLKKHLDLNHIDRVVLAGGICRRPQIRQIKLTLKTFTALPELVKNIVSGGDDQLLRNFIKLVESQGCKVVGADEIVPDILTQEGIIGSVFLKKPDRIDMEVAIEAAIKLGDLDIGQGAVAVGGRIIALEGLEGTDEMLSRVAKLRDTGRLPDNRRGVLVKFCKRQQEKRADLPTIGLESVKHAYAAGLAGIVVEAGCSFILDREEVVKLANDYKMFIIGATR